MSRRLPLFPLGTVVFPGTALPLHIFEPRYRALMDDLTGAELGTPIITPEFGIVLIERGREVGGGEQRAATGTLVRLAEAEQLPDGRWVCLAAGVGRFVVDEALEDDPYPLGMATDLDEEDWDPADRPLLDATEVEVRRVLEQATALGELEEAPTFELDAEPVIAAWQLCGVAPVGTFDRQRLLQTAARRERLELLGRLVGELGALLDERHGG